MKKLLSLLLTAAMLCAVAVPATLTTATTPADNAQTRNADIFDFIDILEDCVGMIELTPVEVYDHNKNGIVDIFDGIIVLEGIIGLGDCVRMPVGKGKNDPVLEGEIDFEVAEYAYLGAGNVNIYLPRQNLITAVNSMTEMREVFKSYEGESFYDADIDESVFADKTAIVFYLYNGSSGSDRTIISSINKKQNSLIIDTVNVYPCNENDDVAWWRIVLLVNRISFNEITLNYKSLSLCEVDNTLGYCNTDCNKAAKNWFDEWLEGNGLELEYYGR